MKQDDDLREFFAAERARDRRAMPAFTDLVDPADSRPAPPTRRARRGRIVWLVTASAATAVLAVRATVDRSGRIATPGAPDAPLGALPGDSIDLDSACDAALAALDEQEADARMRLSTDSLLFGGTASSSD